jgi:hypothetical protein
MKNDINKVNILNSGKKVKHQYNKYEIPSEYDTYLGKERKTI